MTDQNNAPVSNQSIDSAIGDSDADFLSGAFSVDGAAEAIMSGWDNAEEDPGNDPASGNTDDPNNPEQGGGGGTPADGEGEGEGEGTGEGEGGEGEGEGDEGEGSEGDGAGANAQTYPADDAKVTVKVDGTDQEFTVGQLKRLAGQEASLTRKSQEVADNRKHATDLIEVQQHALEAMAQRAMKRFEPYKDIDLNLAAQELEPDVYKALRDDAMTALSDVQFYQQELGQLGQRKAALENAQLQEQAQETLKVLADPDKGIPGFGRDMFLKMRQYALDNGAPQEAVDRAVDPITWRLIHKAMQFDEIQSRGADPATPAKVVTRTGKQVSTTGRTPQKPKKPNAAAQAQKISELSGIDSVEAAANAFLERWGD